MKAKHLFWGFLFITLGVLILINNFSGIYWDWISLWKLWPLVFILWGVAIMIKSNGVKVLIAGLAGIVLGVTLFASYKTVAHLASNDFEIVFDDNQYSDYRYEFTDYSEPYSDSIKTAVLHFKAGAGTFTTESDTISKLFSAHTEGIKNIYELTSNVTDDNAFLTMEMKGAKIRIGNNSVRNRVEMYFNPNPVWELNFDVGAASVNLDLTDVKVKKLKVGMGAASFKAKLGAKTDLTDVNIESGVSEVRLSVPENAGCEIRTEGALNSKDIYGFTKISSDLYRTGNMDSASSKIFIHIDSGVSSIRVDRYSGDWQ